MASTDFRTGLIAGVALSTSLVLTLQILHLWPYSNDKKQANGGETSMLVPSDEILHEQLTRNRKFFGEPGQALVEDSFVVVIGLGGVGSHAAHLLLRSGVGRIRLIDFDQVSVSSLNRHAVANQQDVGLPKVSVLKDHFAKIYPKAVVEAIPVMFSVDRAEELLEGRPDYVLDCIDHLGTKVDLLQYCVQHGLPVLSSMGAGAKADVSKLRYGTLDEAEGDELAVAVRKNLRKKGIPGKKVTVCFVDEKARMKLLPLEKHQEDDPGQFAAIAGLRVRVIPVLGTMPAAMGMALASFVLCALAKQPISITATRAPVTRTLVNKLLKRLQAYEWKEHGIEKLDISLEDLDYVVCNVYRGRCVKTGAKQHPVLLRWDPTKPPTLQNLVMLTEAAAHAHRKITSLDELDQSYVTEVQSYLKEIDDYLAAKVSPLSLETE